MSIEKMPLMKDTKDREKSEVEKKLEIERSIEFSKEKKILLERIDKDKKLSHLKSLVERGLIPLRSVENLVDGKELHRDELKEIFEKIDQMEEMQNIDEILPQRLRVTQEEYIWAIEDRVLRADLLWKLDASLDYLYYSTQGSSIGGVMHFFSSLMHTFDKRSQDVVKVQGNIIDIKRDVEKRA